jgi:hypothetical protein
MRKLELEIKSETLPFGKRWSKGATLRDVLVIQNYYCFNN